jgi:hypothetical protein
MAKRSQGWVKCEGRLFTTKTAPAACHLPRLHDHDSTTREDLSGGARGPRPARVGLLRIRTALMRSEQIAGWSCSGCKPIRARAHYVALAGEAAPQQATPLPLNIKVRENDGRHLGFRS